MANTGTNGRAFSKRYICYFKTYKNVFKEDEVEEKSNLHFLQIANSDKPVAFYSLDVIISIGYRVKSKRGVEFRRWANSVLKQYRLQNPDRKKKK